MQTLKLFIIFICVFIFFLWWRYKIFWPKDPFVIEILGSFVLALFLHFFIKSIDSENTKKNQKNNLNVIRIRLKFLFNRTTKMLNISTETGENKKLYFDNSYINHLYHTIDENLNTIYEYSEHYPDDLFVKNVIQFRTEVENAYIMAEELDILLIKMAKKVNLSDRQMRREIIYYKASKIAEYDPQDVTARLNEPHYSSEYMLDSHPTFVEKYFSVINDEKDKSLAEECNRLEKSIIHKRKELIKKVKKIKIDLN